MRCRPGFPGARGAQEKKADIALISVDLEGGPMSGLAAVRRMCETDPNLRIIFLLSRSQPDLVVEALRAGARGIFSRADFTSASLIRCVHRVHEGQIWLNTEQTLSLFSALNQMHQPRLVDSQGTNLLSNREEEVIRLVAEGRGNREIAMRLKFSEHTVKNYLFRIFDNLGVSNRVELVLYAMSEWEKPLRSFQPKPSLSIVHGARPEISGGFPS